MGDWTEEDWASAGQSMALFLSPGLSTSEHQWIWIALLLQLSGLGPSVQPGRESTIAGISLVSGGNGSLWQGCFVSVGPSGWLRPLPAALLSKGPTFLTWAAP